MKDLLKFLDDQIVEIDTNIAAAEKAGWKDFNETLLRDGFDDDDDEDGTAGASNTGGIT